MLSLLIPASWSLLRPLTENVCFSSFFKWATFIILPSEDSLIKGAWSAVRRPCEPRLDNILPDLFNRTESLMRQSSRPKNITRPWLTFTRRHQMDFNLTARQTEMDLFLKKEVHVAVIELQHLNAVKWEALKVPLDAKLILPFFQQCL